MPFGISLGSSPKRTPQVNRQLQQDIEEQVVQDKEAEIQKVGGLRHRATLIIRASVTSASSQTSENLSNFEMADAPSCAINIRFDPEHAQILEDFQLIAARGDKSQAALQLTEKVIEINASSFHAWAYRWQCLEELGNKADFEAEKRFLEKLAESNCKNYQLWNHRRHLALKLGRAHALDELAFAADCLETDNKNYHTWAHRQSIVQAFGLWEEELQFTQYMLEKDVRNNSAWNQRMFLWKEGPRSKEPGDLETELNFVAAAIKKAFHNESSWNYLQGLIEQNGSYQLLASSRKVHTICQECLERHPSCTPALNLLAGIYLAQGLVTTKTQGSKEASKVLSDLANQCFERLQTADPMRKAYWQFRARSLC